MAGGRAQIWTRTVFLGVVLGGGCSPAGWTADLESAGSTAGQSQKTSERQSFSLGAMGMSIHGFTEEPIYYKNMPKRLDEKARFVPNTEVFASYTRESRDQFILNLGEDCYGQPAFFLGWGPQWQPYRFLEYGLVFGGYYRKTKNIHYDGQTRNMKEVYTLELGGGNQFVPLPLATLGLHFGLTRTTAFGVNLGTNYYLTHVIAVIRFGLTHGG